MEQRPGAMAGLAMNPTFWAGRRVLLTGHTGFKGGWLALWLQRLGAEVIGVALPPPTVPSLFELARVGDDMRSIIADVRDAAAVLAAVEDCQPEIVIHMAAQSLVRAGYADPVMTYATNVMGSVHVLEAVRRVECVRVLLNVTTDKCYENREWYWGYRESEPLGGYDPYSSSKACAELVTAAYRSSYLSHRRPGSAGTAVSTARAGNVIGGGDWAQDRLVPDVMRALLAGSPVDIRRPRAIRPWQHVLEPLCGYLMLIEKMWHDGTNFSEAWNFGPYEDDAQPVGWIVERLAAAWDVPLKVNFEQTGADMHEAAWLKLDCAKARARLGWAPRWRVGRAIDEIAAWYRAYAQGADMREFTVSQIASYMQSDGAHDDTRV